MGPPARGLYRRQGPEQRRLAAASELDPRAGERNILGGGYAASATRSGAWTGTWCVVLGVPQHDVSHQPPEHVQLGSCPELIDTRLAGS